MILNKESIMTTVSKKEKGCPHDFFFTYNALSNNPPPSGQV